MDAYMAADVAIDMAADVAFFIFIFWSDDVAFVDDMAVGQYQVLG